MRNFFTVFFIALFSLTAFAQQGEYLYHEVADGETVYSISKKYDISIAELEKFNPDVKSGLKEKMLLLIPKKNSPKPKTTGAGEKYKTHIVEDGQTLYSISRSYDVTIEIIKKVNPELKDGLKIGQELLIPLTPKPQQAPAPNPNQIAHKVMAGETLYSLALKYGVPIPEIKKENPDLAEEGLKAGDVIYIPNNKKETPKAGQEDRDRLAREAAKAENERTAAAGAAEFTLGNFHVHKVEARQTAYSISQQYHISLDSLYILNPEAEDGLRIGQLLKLPKNRAKYSDQNLVQNQQKPKEELASDTISKSTEAKSDTAGGFFLYQLKTGDSFYSLKNQFNVTREELVKLNPEISGGLTLDKYIIIPKKKKEVDVSWLDKIFSEVETPPQSPGPPGEEKVLKKDSLNKGDKNVSERPAEVNEDTLKIDISRLYKVGVMLPFNAVTDTSFDYRAEVPPSSHYVLDFYNGLLMAADTLAAQGMNLEMTVYDTRNSLFTMREKIEEVKDARHDMLIGPLFQKNVEYAADELRGLGTPVISPLSKAVDVSDRPNLVKCVPDNQAGVQEISELINVNYQDARIVFGHANTADDREKVRQIKSRILPRSSNDFFETVVNTDKLISRTELSAAMSKDKPNVVVVFSEDKVFLSDLISKLRTMRSMQVSLIGPPKLLQIPTLEMDYLNNLKLTMIDASFIDYGDEATTHFIGKYRERYGNEPSQIAFQGYDVGMYFLTKLWKSGPFVLNTIGEGQTLLNTGFRMVKTNDGGYHNHFMHVTGIRDYNLVKITPGPVQHASATKPTPIEEE